MELTGFFSSLDPTVKAASVGIAVLAAAAWFTWNPKVNATSAELKKLRKHSDESEPPGRGAIKEAVQSPPDVLY